MKENIYFNLTGLSLGLIVVSFIYYCFYQGFRIFVITSCSMEPALKSGSLIITQPQTSYFPGQVITFYSSHAQETSKNNPSNNKEPLLITHRIVSTIKNNGLRSYMTKGDANSHPDEQPVPHQFVIGRVWLAIPFMGVFFVWIYSKLGFYLVILLPIIFLIVSQIKKIIQLIFIDKF